MDKLLFAAIDDNGDIAMLYKEEENADRFCAHWNANEESVTRYGKCRTALVRVTECADYLNTPPLT